MVRFTLYIAGDSYRSQRAVANLKKLGEQRLLGEYDLVVVDVRTDPDAAERDRILTTPTLIKTEPSPTRRVTGDLIDAEQVLMALGLPSGPET